MCNCYGSLHTEKLMMIHGNVAPTKKSVCLLLLAETLNLTQRDYSFTFIVSMPPRRRQTISSDVMLPIIGLRRTGLKQMDIGNQFGVSQSDVSRILPEHHQTGSAKDRPRQGRTKNTNAWEDRVLARMAMQNMTKSSSQLAREWGHALQTWLSRFIVSHQISSAGIRSRKPRKQAPLTVRHKRECVQWARQQSPRKVRFWHCKMWIDESRFCLYHVDGRFRVWRRHGKYYKQNCVQPRH